MSERGAMARQGQGAGRSSCTRSSGATTRATRRWKSSTAPSLRCGRGSRSRWSRRPAPASRRCCTSPACSSIPTPARSMSTAPPPRRCRDAERTRIRRTEIGFVYQFHHLLPEFSALENVMLPQMIRGLSRKRGAQARATSCSSYLGLKERLEHRPGANCPAASSSASRSRARSPMRRASCSPTSRPAISIRAPPSHVFDALTQLVRASGLAAVIATHNMELARRMDRRVTLRGRAGGGGRSERPRRC